MKVTKSSGPEVTVAEYAYDALGRRIRKIDSIGSETTLYYYNNNWQVVTEADSVGDTARYFVYGNFIDELLMMHDCSTDEDYYACQDHLYSNVALADQNGIVVERYEYDAYGKPTIYNADFTQTYSDSQYGNSYMFTGRRLDTLDNSGLKLQYNRNRYYDSKTARWLTKDPLGYPDGMNPYEYVQSNPCLYIDPYGTLMVLDTKKYMNRRTMSHRGVVSEKILPKNIKCSGRRLRILIRLSVKLKLLRSKHRRWRDRNSNYDSKWGNKEYRSDSRERAATLAHEMDHFKTFTVGFWPKAKALDAYHNRLYCNKEQCQKISKCLKNKFNAFIAKAESHCASFDTKAWNWGGAYSKNPFNGKLDLSSCKECGECKGPVCPIKK